VPVRDGKSQNKFLLDAQKIQAISENANNTFYSLEEVGQHKKEDDCWTIF